MLEHGVHGHEQLAHACGESHLGRFSLAAQMLVEAADHRVATHGSDRGHVQRAAHLRAAAPDDTSALVLAAVAIEPVSYTHLRAHETPEHLVCRLLLEK